MVPISPRWLALVLVVAGYDAVAQQVVTVADRIRVLSGDIRSATETLDAEWPRMISDSIVMNTVRQYPKRGELDGYLEQRSAEARAWESKLAAGEARRTRVLNPYDGSTYTRFYDADGNWQYSVIENDYRATEKLQADWNAKFQRARATLDELRRDYETVAAGGGMTAAERSELDGMLATASERVGQFGSPPPELLPRPVDGDDNSPFPTYKAFDAFTGKVIDMGRTGSNPRPVAIDAPAGQPAPVTPAAAPDPVLGTWTGFNGSTQVTFVFRQGGRWEVTMQDRRRRLTGEGWWKKNPDGTYQVRAPVPGLPHGYVTDPRCGFRGGTLVVLGARLTKQ